MAMFVRTESRRQTGHSSSILMDTSDETLISRYDNAWSVFKNIFNIPLYLNPNIPVIIHDDSI